MSSPTFRAIGVAAAFTLAPCLVGAADSPARPQPKPTPYPPFNAPDADRLRSQQVGRVRDPNGPIQPPFGLTWGEEQAHLEKLITNVKATIVSREKTASGEEWVVTGLLQTGLKETRFRFVDDSLASVALVYERPDWADAEYRKFFDEVAGRLTQRFGPAMKAAAETGTPTAPELCWRRDAVIRLQRLPHHDAPSRIIVSYER